jgi:hypothetical protein
MLINVFLKDEIIDIPAGPKQRDFENIQKQMEPHDTSSGCWSGGSTIQTVSDMVPPYSFVQELNDQNLQRHNSQTSDRPKSAVNRVLLLAGRTDCVCTDESDRISSTDSSSGARLTPLGVLPPPPPPTRSDSIKSKGRRSLSPQING